MENKLIQINESRRAKGWRQTEKKWVGGIHKYGWDKCKTCYKNHLCKVKENKSQQSCGKGVFNDKTPKFLGQKMPSISKTARTWLSPSPIQWVHTSWDDEKEMIWEQGGNHTLETVSS